MVRSLAANIIVSLSSTGTQLPAKNISSVQFGQGHTALSSTTLQPSQVSFIQFDPSSQLFGTNQILGTSQTQNVNNSQIMGNHMVQPR